MVNFRSLPDAPVTDEPSNPFWLPCQPAAEFIQSLADALDVEGYPSLNEGRSSFLRRLYAVKLVEATKSHLKDPMLSLDPAKRDKPMTTAQMMNPDHPFPTEDTAKLWETRLTTPELLDIRTAPRKTKAAISMLSRYPELLRPDIVRVPANESQSSHDSSFDISTCEAPNLDRSMSSSQAFCFGSPAYTQAHTAFYPYRYDVSGRSSRKTRNVLGEYAKALQKLEDQLYGPDYGSCDMDTVALLLEDLDCLLPGARLKKNISSIVGDREFDPTYQSVLDYLAHHGHISAATLELFRALEGILRLDLRASLKPAMLYAPASHLDDVLSVLKKPNSFHDLTDLILDGIPLQYYNLISISSLPRLKRLSLPDTGITNEAIPYIVPLKRTLTSLNLAGNSDLSDDCCINLMYLDLLLALNIYDTSISMTGLRRFCQSVQPSGRTVGIELPLECIDYLSSVSSEYAIHLSCAGTHTNQQHSQAFAVSMNTAYPLIEEPAECPNLSTAALKYNLSVHSLCNPSIPKGGTREDMVKRLGALLEKRKADIRVLEVLGWKEDLLREVSNPEPRSGIAKDRDIGGKVYMKKDGGMFWTRVA